MRRTALALALLLGFCRAAPAQVTIGADDYLDRLKGMWLGELMGNYAGRAREGSIARGGLNYVVNWTDANHIDPNSNSKDYVFRDATWDGDDDTCFEYVYMNVLQSDADPTSAQIGQVWATHLPDPSFYIANRQGRHLISTGLVPPATGSINRNVHWYAIDSQITTESLGAIAPGMIQRASDLAGRFGSVTNDGFALHAAQYYAAMYSAAVTESNVVNLVAIGQQMVPTTSRTWQIVQDVRSWYQQDLADGNLDWRATQSLAYDRYYAASNGRYRWWYESSANTAMTTLALLYGQGDLQKTVEIAVQAGFDADCNPATAGGLVGLMKGYSNLSADFLSRAGTQYLASGYWTGITRDANLARIAEGYQTAAEAQILLMGGSITGTGAARVYHIPNVPLAPLLEKPDPNGPRGLVGAVKAVGGSVAVKASVAFHDPTDDTRNLEGIIDGIVDVSYNGHRSYSTSDGHNSQPAGGDFYELDFDRRWRFTSLVYCEGEAVLARGNAFLDSNTEPPLGGWFTDLLVEVSDDGPFVPVTGLTLSEPLDVYKLYQVITLTFDPIEGNAIRIRGTAGGTDQFTICVELEAYGYVPGATGNLWKLPGGDWGDSNGWTGGVPAGGSGVVVGNGGVVAISQPGAACDSLVLGQHYMESGSVNMKGGRLDANRVTVGLGGAGTFTQSGGDLHVQQSLCIATESNSAGTYTLQGGHLYAGAIAVGGSGTEKGGVGTLSISGGNAIVNGTLRIWGGGTLNLGLGGLVNSDANHPALDVFNDGWVEVGDGNGAPVVCCFGDVTGNGDIVIGSGATLWVGSLEQNSVRIGAGGTLILAAEDPLLYQATAMRNYEQAVPEPGCLALIVLGSPWLAWRRGKRR